MKNVLIFSLLFLGIGIGFTSCLTDSEDQATIEQVSENDSPEKAIGIKFKAKLYRPKKVLNNGRECDCKACFGICDISFEITIDDIFTPIRIVNENGLTHLYLEKEVGHAEDLFYVDNELEVVVDEDGEQVYRVLKAGVYNFQQMGEYEDPDPENPTFGRVEVIVE